MKQKWNIVWALAALALVLSACAAPQAAETPAAAPLELTVMTHDSFAVSEEVIAEFEAANQVKVVFLKSGDTGSVLNRAILSKDAPLADVLYGVDNTFLSRALEADIFEAYESAGSEGVAAEFRLDPQNRLTPVDYGDVCINYDKAYFAEKGLALPQSLDDLLKPEYKGLLVVQNPATSSPGLAFLLATVAEYGEDGYLDFWAALRANGVVVVNDWETAYYTNFSASTGKGEQPMVVSYGSSPPVEVVYAEQPLDDAPTASLVGDNMCFRQVEFVGVLKGAKNPEAARKFVDFMLSKRFQEDMPLQMFVFPVLAEASLPDVFVKYAQMPQVPAALDPQLIADNREKWIDAWDEVVLK
ncbi:ABC transporter substrate-binding protein [Ornatilinea apprima]|uniref:ABC transporter substrate-binding protein n=1 Tax=Ornatilinea apprima TaxID=1134406 RepID=A0A0P6X4H8_9CHLR|nr:thiamine ABC transporter substrate-binding protein [Ornatilinea apprima]KPL74801.1 ABC transporter substrate-binding protein [Ornatilinea apprima]